MLARRTCELRMETFEVESCIRGYHVAQPQGKNSTACEKGETPRICYAVVVIRRSAVVGHMSPERCQSLMHCS